MTRFSSPPPLTVSQTKDSTRKRGLGRFCVGERLCQPYVDDLADLAWEITLLARSWLMIPPLSLGFWGFGPYWRVIGSVSLSNGSFMIIENGFENWRIWIFS